jgi:hypothetical protein
VLFRSSPQAARGRVALSLVLTMAPFAVVAPFLGPAIDRSRRGRRAMVFGSCAGRALTCLAMARVIDGLLLFPSAFTALVLAKAYSVAKSSLVPAAVDDEHALVEANSKLAVTTVVIGFAAALPAIVVLRLLGGSWVLRLAAVVLAVAAVSSLRIHERRRDDDELSPADADTTVRVGPGVTVAAVVMALLRAVVGFLTFLVAFAFRRSGAPSWWFGVVVAASMLATLVGAVVAPRLRQLVHEERILVASLWAVAVAALGGARLEGRLWAAAVAAGVGLGASAGRLAFDALVQRDAPDAIRGRSFARFEAGFQLVWVVGALLPVVVPTPLRQGFDVIGISALAAAVGYMAAGRHLARARS